MGRKGDVARDGGGVEVVHGGGSAEEPAIKVVALALRVGRLGGRLVFLHRLGVHVGATGGVEGHGVGLGLGLGRRRRLRRRLNLGPLCLRGDVAVDDGASGHRVVARIPADEGIAIARRLGGKGADRISRLNVVQGNSSSVVIEGHGEQLLNAHVKRGGVGFGRRVVLVVDLVTAAVGHDPAGAGLGIVDGLHLVVGALAVEDLARHDVGAAAVVAKGAAANRDGRTGALVVARDVARKPAAVDRGRALGNLHGLPRSARADKAAARDVQLGARARDNRGVLACGGIRSGDHVDRGGALHAKGAHGSAAPRGILALHLQAATVVVPQRERGAVAARGEHDAVANVAVDVAPGNRKLARALHLNGGTAALGAEVVAVEVDGEAAARGNLHALEGVGLQRDGVALPSGVHGALERGVGRIADLGNHRGPLGLKREVARHGRVEVEVLARVVVGPAEEKVAVLDHVRNLGHVDLAGVQNLLGINLPRRSALGVELHRAAQLLHLGLGAALGLPELLGLFPTVKVDLAKEAVHAGDAVGVGRLGRLGRGDGIGAGRGIVIEHRAAGALAGARGIEAVGAAIKHDAGAVVIDWGHAIGVARKAHVSGLHGHGPLPAGLNDGTRGAVGIGGDVGARKDVDVAHVGRDAGVVGDRCRARAKLEVELGRLVPERRRNGVGAVLLHQATALAGVRDDDPREHADGDHVVVEALGVGDRVALEIKRGLFDGTRGGVNAHGAADVLAKLVGPAGRHVEDPGAAVGILEIALVEREGTGLCLRRGGKQGGHEEDGEQREKRAAFGHGVLPSQISIARQHPAGIQKTLTP